jgi:hypothetical protein
VVADVRRGRYLARHSRVSGRGLLLPTAPGVGHSSARPRRCGPDLRVRLGG